MIEWTVYVQTFMFCSLVAKDINKAKGEVIKVYPNFGIILANFKPELYEYVTRLPGVRKVEQ